MTYKKNLIPLIIVLTTIILIFAVFLLHKKADNKQDIKTADLLESILNDQSFMVISFISSHSHNYTEKWKNEYSAINDLLARNDAAKVIYKKYCKLFPNGRQQGAFYAGEGQVVLCLLFSDDIYPQLSEKQKEKIGEDPFINNPPEITFDSSYIIAYDIDSEN